MPVCLPAACQDPDLIGDSTRPYVLPLVQTSRNNDLKAISGQTLSQLMDGYFDGLVESFEIVDCRCVCVCVCVCHAAAGGGGGGETAGQEWKTHQWCYA